MFTSMFTSILDFIEDLGRQMRSWSIYFLHLQNLRKDNILCTTSDNILCMKKETICSLHRIECHRKAGLSHWMRGYSHVMRNRFCCNEKSVLIEWEVFLIGNENEKVYPVQRAYGWSRGFLIGPIPVPALYSLVWSAFIVGWFPSSLVLFVLSASFFFLIG